MHGIALFITLPAFIVHVDIFCLQVLFSVYLTLLDHAIVRGFLSVRPSVLP